MDVEKLLYRVKLELVIHLEWMIALVPFGIQALRSLEDERRAKPSFTLIEMFYGIFLRSLTEFTLTLPPIYFLSKMPIQTVIAIFALTYIAMISLYESLYLFNDVIAVRWEDVPSMRFYIRKVPIRGAVLIRFVYIALVAVALIYFFSLNLMGLFIASLLLVFYLLVHNSIKVKAKRVHSFASVRLSRILFAGVAMLYPRLDVLSKVFVVVLPYIVSELVSARDYHIKRYTKNFALKLPDPNLPDYIKYSLFLPLQLTILGVEDVKLLLGNFIIIVISALRALIARICGFDIAKIPRMIYDAVRSKRSGLQGNIH